MGAYILGLVTGVLFLYMGWRLHRGACNRSVISVYGMEAYIVGLVTGVLFLYMGWRLTSWGL